MPDTVQPFPGSDNTRCCDNTICPPEDGHVDARNVSRIIMQHTYCYRIKELYIKLVIETSLYYDARAEKHQIMNLSCQGMCPVTVHFEHESKNYYSTRGQEFFGRAE
jgi:hypothetical protein